MNMNKLKKLKKIIKKIKKKCWWQVEKIEQDNQKNIEEKSKQWWKRTIWLLRKINIQQENEQ